VDPNTNSNLFQAVTLLREEKEKNERMNQQNIQQENQASLDCFLQKETHTNILMF